MAGFSLSRNGCYLGMVAESHPSIEILQWNSKKMAGFQIQAVTGGMDVIRNGCRLDTMVYRKPTDKGLLLHYHSHVRRQIQMVTAEHYA